jgi:hypothetical protein
MKLLKFPWSIYLWYWHTSSEIIQSVAYYDNYDGFQHVNFIFSYKIHFTILTII